MSTSWTDLNITDSLRAACADVRKKTNEDFGQFVKDSLALFGVEKIEDLTIAQRKHLEEHIDKNWKGFYLTEATGVNPQVVDSEGRSSLKEEEIEAAETIKPHDDHKGNPGGENEADKINAITKENSTPKGGSVVQEPGVKTDAANSLSPEENSRILDAAKKLGLAK